VVVGVVLAGRERHRRFSEAQKIAIIGESFLPGVRVREVMERHGLASSVIYTWRKQARQGHFSGGRSGMFAPVAIVEPQADVTNESAICVAVAQDLEQGPLQHDPIVPESADPAPQSDGAAMVVALPDGVRILVNNGVDEGALGKVLRALALVAGR
jgi:transposase